MEIGSTTLICHLPLAICYVPLRHFPLAICYSPFRRASFGRAMELGSTTHTHTHTHAHTHTRAEPELPSNELLSYMRYYAIMARLRPKIENQGFPIDSKNKMFCCICWFLGLGVVLDRRGIFKKSGDLISAPELGSGAISPCNKYVGRHNENQRKKSYRFIGSNQFL